MCVAVLSLFRLSASGLFAFQALFASIQSIMGLIVVALALCALPSLAWAQEEVLDLRTRIEIDETGRARISHVIEVQAEADEIEHGIYFEVPKPIGPVEDITVTREGADEPWEFKKRRLRIGDEDVVLAPGPYRYEIGYTAPTPFLLREEDNAVVLTWEPLIGEFDLPWRQSSVAIVWPESVPRDGLEGDAFVPGMRNNDTSMTWTARSGALVPEMIIRWTRSAFPAEAVRVPSVNQTMRLVALLGTIGIVLTMHLTWMRIGRDRRSGAVQPTLEPPAHVSAAAARYVSRMSYDAQCFAAALVSLVSQRVLTLSIENGKTAYLARGSGPTPEAPGDLAVLEGLLGNKEAAIIRGTDDRINETLMSHLRVLRAEYQKANWVRNRRIWTTIMIMAAVFSGGLVAAIFFETRNYDEDQVAIGVAVLGAGFSLLVPLLYNSQMKAPTVAGRHLMDEIEGLKLGLSDPTPLYAEDATAANFMAYLPYAIALDVEKEWRARFGPNGEGLEQTKGVDDLMAWYSVFRRMEDTTVTASLVPFIAASTGTAAGTTTTSSGASAGGW